MTGPDKTSQIWHCLLCEHSVEAKDDGVEGAFFSHFENEHESAEPLYSNVRTIENE